MRSFSEITGREKLIEIVRWFCVLPAAAIGEFVASLVVRAVVGIASYCGLGILANSTFAYWFGLFLSYGPQKAVLVVLGSKMAPRRQLTSSIVLTVIGFSLSLMTHVLGQHLAGNQVGIVNCSHLFAESAGLLGGTAYMVFEIARKRRRATDVAVQVWHCLAACLKRTSRCVGQRRWNGYQAAGGQAVGSASVAGTPLFGKGVFQTLRLRFRAPQHAALLTCRQVAVRVCWQ